MFYIILGINVISDRFCSSFSKAHLHTNTHQTVILLIATQSYLENCLYVYL